MKLIKRCSLHILHNKIMIREVRKMRKCCGRGTERYSPTLSTCIVQQVTLLTPVDFIHFYTLSVRCANNQNTCRIRRTGILLMTWNVPVFLSETQRATLETKPVETPMQLFQEDWRYKSLPLPFTHPLVFLSLHTVLKPSSSVFTIPKSVEVWNPYALGTETRLPNLSASLLWYELEVNATCLDSINSYYSLLSTGDLPQGCLSLSPCRTAATRDAEEPGLHHPSLGSGCHQLRVSEGWLSSSHRRDTGKNFSPLFFNLIMILSVPSSLPGGPQLD